MEEPMGPRPYWATRIFFFTLQFLNDLRSQYVKGLADGLQPNLQRAMTRGADTLRTSASISHSVAPG